MDSFAESWWGVNHKSMPLFGLASKEIQFNWTVGYPSFMNALNHNHVGYFQTHHTRSVSLTHLPPIPKLRRSKKEFIRKSSMLCARSVRVGDWRRPWHSDSSTHHFVTTTTWNRSLSTYSRGEEDTIIITTRCLGVVKPPTAQSHRGAQIDACLNIHSTSYTISIMSSNTMYL